MKRLYACVVIVAVVCLLTWKGSNAMRQFSDAMQTELNTTRIAAENQDQDGTVQAAQQCLQILQAREGQLSTFVQLDQLAALAQSLMTIEHYAVTGQLDEAAAECARASAELTTLRRLFFRVL